MYSDECGDIDVEFIGNGCGSYILFLVLDLNGVFVDRFF